MPVYLYDSISIYQKYQIDSRRLVGLLAPLCFSSLCFPVFSTFFFSSNINYIYHPTYKTVMKVLLCTIIKVAGAKDKRTIVCVFLEVTALVFLYFSSLRLFPYFISKFSDSAKQGPGHLLRGEGWCEDKLTALYHFFVSRQKWVK